jgi:hypothetical protein
MDRLILWALPASLRERHGDELEDMLATTSRPVLDRADLLLAALGLRLAATLRPLLAAAVLGSIGCGLGLLHAVRNLRDGAVEIPYHWWSTAFAAGFACSLAAALALGLASHRAIAWRQPG